MPPASSAWTSGVRNHRDQHDHRHALTQVRRFDEAITAFPRAGDICRELGNRHDEGAVWNNLGDALADARRFDEGAR